VNDQDKQRAWVAEQRDQMLSHLARACDHFGVTIAGELVTGWHVRSVSGPVLEHGDARWLRVGREYLQWIEDPDVGDHWTGVPDSNTIIGVPKPTVLGSVEWPDSDGERCVRADLMTVMPGRPCSPTEALRTPLELPEAWWSDLRRSIDVVRMTSTGRYASRVGHRDVRVRTVFGDAVADAMRPTEWETTHGDLHWSNVCGPEFGLLDWELWGLGPVGNDAVSLYLFSLLVPEVAQQVHDVFADILDSPHGRIAQVSVASRILHRAEEGENLDLAAAVRHHIQPLVGLIPAQL